MSDRTVTWLVMFALVEGLCAGALLDRAMVEDEPEALGSMGLVFIAFNLLFVCASYVWVWIKKSQARRSGREVQ